LTSLRFFVAVFFSGACFSLVFFLAAIRAVYHRHIPAPNPSQTQTFRNFAPPIFRT
jgi:tellurite resistance protein TehA-like permease